MERTSALYKIRRKGQVIANRVFPREMMAKLYSRVVLKKKVNLSDPKTFNEKIQWCKLYYYPNEPLVVQCADKYQVREYVAKKGLAQILVPSYGSWTDASKIDWEQLPQRFVLKCAHGCAYNILCPDKDTLDKVAVAKQLYRWLKEDFGEFNLERHYSKISPRRIVSEEYLGATIMDCKFFCFNGEPKYVYISNNMICDRQAQMTFFNVDGTKIPMTRDDYEELPTAELPVFFDEMKAAAQVLCEDFPFVRVDFFMANGTYYFAELTFTPGGGMMPFHPDKFDLEWGQNLDIRQQMKKYGKKKN